MHAYNLSSSGTFDDRIEVKMPMGLNQPSLMQQKVEGLVPKAVMADRELPGTWSVDLHESSVVIAIHGWSMRNLAALKELLSYAGLRFHSQHEELDIYPPADAKIFEFLPPLIQKIAGDCGARGALLHRDSFRMSLREEPNGKNTYVHIHHSDWP